MATGAMWLATAPAGGRGCLRQDGLRIASVIGLGSALGAGPGLKLNLGASLHSTMGVGLLLVVAGYGFLARALFDPCMLPHWWLGLAVRGSAREWDGSRLHPERCSCPDIT